METVTPQAIEPLSQKRAGGGFQWWLAIMVGIIAAMGFAIIFTEEYREAFVNIIPGIWTTLLLTVGAFLASIPLGLLIATGRLSKREWLKTIATVYIEFVRGVPMLVFIFAIALVLAPDFAGLIGVKSRSIPMVWRGGAALCLFYAAFIAEVFRAGIQSVEAGQIEAGKAVGMSPRMIMRHITLPQAIRNTLPALGNDLIALMKDTSLVSVLAVNELTQKARLYSGSSFRFRESFFILVVLYVLFTLLLSLLLRWYENRIAIPGN